MNLSEAFKAYLDNERSWMTYRAANLLYYPSDPRWKGLQWRELHNSAREAYNDLAAELWKRLTEIEQVALDPPEPWVGAGRIQEIYEVKILLRLQGTHLDFGWPSPLCHLIGHLRPSEEGGLRFTCMNCWKLYDRDPTNDSLIVGAPDEAWIADAFDKALCASGPVAGRESRSPEAVGLSTGSDSKGDQG